jgi:hypothetical protein
LWRRQRPKLGCGANEREIKDIKYYWGDQVKGDEMGGDSSTHGTDEKCIQNFGRKN